MKQACSCEKATGATDSAVGSGFLFFASCVALLGGAVTASPAEDPTPHVPVVEAAQPTPSPGAESETADPRRARRHLTSSVLTPLLLSVTDPYAGCGGGERNTAMEPSLAIGGDGADRRMVATWYQDFAGAETHMTQGVGLVAAMSGDGVIWTEHMVPFTSCFPGGPDLATTGNARVSVGPDGAAYFVSVSDVPNASLDVVVTATADGGDTWAPIGNFAWGDEPSITADPLVPGRAYAAWLKWSGDATTVATATTADLGQSWRFGIIAVVWPNWPLIVIDPKATLETMYCFFSLCHNTVSTAYDLQVVRSTDGGVSWSVPTTVFHGPGTYGPRPGAVVGPDGTVYVAWDAGDGIVLVSVSVDRGEHWSTPVTVPGAGDRPSLAVTSSGLVGVFYADASPWPSTQYFKVTTTDGTSFSAPAAVSCHFDRSSSPLGGFLGDYSISAAADGDRLYAVFAATPCDGSGRDASSVNVYLAH